VDDATGQPVEGMMINANPAKPRQANVYVPHYTTSAKDGTFTIPGLEEGTYSLFINPNWSDLKCDYQMKNVGSVAAGTADLRIGLAKGLAISGTVKDEDGKAVTGIYVQAMGKDDKGNYDYSRQRNCQTQTDGSFRLGGLPVGVYDLTVQAMGGSGGSTAPTSMKGVAAGTEGVTITVRKGVTITGRVVDEKGQAPGQAGNLQIAPSDGGGGGPGGGTLWANYGESIPRGRASRASRSTPAPTGRTVRPPAATSGPCRGTTGSSP
jgi:hypothetical protein